jgi:hypothetical protein
MAPSSTKPQREQMAVSEGSDEDLVLTDAEKQALIALLKRTIDEARFPYSPQLAPLKVILAKLVPPAPLPAPRPPPRAGMGPSHGRGRRRR